MDRIDQYTDEAALADYNVTACFPDMETARKAIGALGRHDPRKLHRFDAEGNEVAA